MTDEAYERSHTGAAAETEVVLKRVFNERQRQIYEKGWMPAHDMNHSPLAWVGIIAHELGCLADAALNRPGERGPRLTGYRKIAAVAVAAMEADYRNVVGCAIVTDEMMRQEAMRDARTRKEQDDD